MSQSNTRKFAVPSDIMQGLNDAKNFKNTSVRHIPLAAENVFDIIETLQKYQITDNNIWQLVNRAAKLVVDCFRLSSSNLVAPTTMQDDVSKLANLLNEVHRTFIDLGKTGEHATTKATIMFVERINRNLDSFKSLAMPQGTDTTSNPHVSSGTAERPKRNIITAAGALQSMILNSGHTTDTTVVVDSSGKRTIVDHTFSDSDTPTDNTPRVLATGNYAIVIDSGHSDTSRYHLPEGSAIPSLPVRVTGSGQYAGALDLFDKLALGGGSEARYGDAHPIWRRGEPLLRDGELQGDGDKAPES